MFLHSGYVQITRSLKCFVVTQFQRKLKARFAYSSSGAERSLAGALIFFPLSFVSECPPASCSLS